MASWSEIPIFQNEIILLINFLAYENYKIQDPVFRPFSANEDLLKKCVL